MLYLFLLIIYYLLGNNSIFYPHEPFNVNWIERINYKKYKNQHLIWYAK